ncbi:hypothetical protein Tco_0590075 [Tanacetum coccineum]
MSISSSSSSSSSDNKVQNYSKQCLESFKTLQKNYDSEREKHSRARLEIQGYELALESLESRIIGHEKNELAWGEKYEFQNYELKCREVKINNLKMELEKVVKERDELKVKIEKWEESSKGLNKLLNSQMSAKDKNGLGYGTQLDEISNKSETDSEISMSVFEVRSSDEEITPANDRFSKVDGYHVVLPPIIGNFLTPRTDISFAGLDEYVIRKKIIESKTTKLKDDTSESETSETVGKTNEVQKSRPKINKDKVIIEDWNSNDEDDVSEVNTDNPIKTNETQTVITQVDKIGQISQKEGIGFKKTKACFVCKSTDHLIKDCDFYAKKSPEPKLKTVVNTGQRVVKPVWDNAKRVNHQKISNKLKYTQTKRTFVPKGVLTKTCLINPIRPNRKRAVHTVSIARPISFAKPISTARPVSTARLSAPKIAQTGSAIRPIYPRMDNVRPRASYSPIKRYYYTRPAVRPKDLKQDVKTGKGKMDNALKKSRWVWRPKGNYMDHESKEKESFILKKFEDLFLGEPTEPQPTPSPTQPSTGDQPPETSSSHATTQDSKDSLEGTNRNEGDQVQEPHDSPLSSDHTSDRAEGTLNLQELSVLCTNLSNRVLALESIKDAQAAKISALKSRIKKLEKKKKESVSKQGRKKSKPESTLDNSTVFDDQDADHDKSSGDKRGNDEELVSTARPEVSTARPDIDAARQEDSAIRSNWSM